MYNLKFLFKNKLFGLLLATQITAMDFQELHNDTDCDCICSACQNCVDTFCRKSTDGQFKDRSFRIPKKDRDAPFIDCENHCATKSLSIALWDDESCGFLKNYYSGKLSLEIAPQFRTNLIIFKIKQYGGLVKHTPVDGNDYHYDYYQPDSFSVIKSLEYIKTIKLNPDDV